MDRIQEEKSESTDSEMGNRDHRIQASKMGNQEIMPIFDRDFHKKLRVIKDNFWKEYRNFPLNFVATVMADGEAVIHVLMERSELSNSLPNKYEGYPVLFSYGSIQPDHRNFHKELKPGISIGRSSNPSNACTLGALFQKEGCDDVFILTANHVIGNEEDIVFQPGRLDMTDTTICAKISQYSFLGIDDDGHILDYSFCKLDGCRNIPMIPNVLYCTSITLKSCKPDVFEKNEGYFVPVQKVGRTTFHTEGWTNDFYDSFTPEVISPPIEEATAIVVYGIGGNTFGQEGDSGSAVFDENGLLWGIYHGSARPFPYHIVIPIHLILKDVNNRFGVKFKLI